MHNDMFYSSKIYTIGAFFSCIYLLWLSPVLAQAKKPLIAGDYGKWSTVTLRDISSDGQWCPYYLMYGNGVDSLFVKNTHTGRTYSFPFAQNGAFGKNTFSALGSDNILRVRNLKTGTLLAYPHISRFAYTLDGSRIIVAGSDKSLKLINESGGELLRCDSIISFEQSPKGDRLAYWAMKGSASVLEVVDLKAFSKTSVYSEAYQNQGLLIWDDQGIGLLSTCNAEDITGNSALYYDCAKGKSYILNKEIRGTFAAWTLNPGGMHIAQDGKAYLLYAPSPVDGDRNELAEVWHAADKRLYPIRNSNGPKENQSLLFRWDPAEKTFEQLSAQGMPFMCLSTDAKYLLQWDKFAKEPQTAKEAVRDIYCRDIIKGTTTKLITGIPGNELMLLASPKGGFVVYFKEGDWHLYSHKTGKAMALGAHAGVTVSKPEDDVHKEKVPIDLVYFSKDEKWIFFRDEFDWWAIATEKLQVRRLTHGRAKKLQYQIAPSCYEHKPGRYGGSYARTIDMDKPLLFFKTSIEDYSTGYSLMGKDGKETHLPFGPFRLSQARMASSGTVAFLKEDFKTSPCIEIIEKPYKTCQRIYESNTHEKGHEWGSVAIKYYKRVNGKELGSLVYYPPGFDKNRKYPVLVYIYENLSHNLHTHINPSISESIGFNIPDLLAQGYIVFLPDTESDLGNPGPANVDCVTSAVNMLVGEGYADAGRIGLIGHSHGGYKAMYIITRTPIFKAAMAGDGISNMVTDYLTKSIWEGPLYWRYEHDQLRMGMPLYGNMDDYIKNSALFSADSITTPLLGWSGKEDYHVVKEQTMQMYFALRRLGKEHIMLLYPDEGHSLEDPAHQADLRNKLLDWFGFYLRSQPKAAWMHPGE
ncbi:MAG: hypothetical protein DI539_11685 [Flavobacterium psychrophilum]|nr:MAG: hypothetical protein DI539_11685 [Flavobacterium psychrophilum]